MPRELAHWVRSFAGRRVLLVGDLILDRYVCGADASAIEPRIGHLKSDYRKDRCILAGLAGDAINAVLAAAGSDLRKRLRRLAAVLIRWLHGTMHRPASLIRRLAMPRHTPQSAIAA